MAMIVYVMGKSASGKDTVYKELQLIHPRWKQVLLYTTRPVRDGETDGAEYHFVTEGVLERLRLDGKVIEERTYETIHGPWTYFTADDGQIRLDGNGCYLMIGTLESYAEIRKYYGEEFLMPVYIEVEDGIRLQRALDRERSQKKPKYRELCRRFLADEEDFKNENLDVCGISKRYRNETLEQCLKEIDVDIKQMGLE